MKYLMDTDHLSVLQQQSGSDFVALLAHLAQHSPTDIVLSVISYHEQMSGCNTYISRARNSTDLVNGYARLSRLLSDYATATVLPFDSAAASVYDQLVSQRVRIGTMDLRIAAIALACGLILLTRNRQDFQKVPGLTFEDWTV